MKNWLKILIITSLIVNSFTYGFSASAQISVFSMQIDEMKDGIAILTWHTNEDVKSEVFYGLDITNLDKKLTYNTYKRNHEANLYGLEKDKIYYYRINLYNRAGERLSLYTRSFKTDDMEDTKPPRFIDAYTIQTIGNAVALYWKANEKVSSEIEYYKQGDSDNKIRTRAGRYQEETSAFLYNLDTYAEYYIRIIIRDEAGNRKSTTLSTNIYGQFNNDINLEIKDIEPLSSNSNLIYSDKATIKFKTNMVSKSYIAYDTDPNRLRGRLEINKDKLSTNHEITLPDLEPNTTYYYNLYAHDSFYRKHGEEVGLSFTTKGSVLGVKEAGDKSDNDNDNLSYSFEMAIGTDPNNPDTDNDGYRDDIEVANGYDPLGPGKWKTSIQFFYGQPRLDLNYEQAKAKELKKVVDEKLRYLYISPSKWNMLVNAYVYGDYPIDAILMYVKLDGYTVHPSISWHQWKDTENYKKYEQYIRN